MKKLIYIGALASLFWSCETDLASPEAEGGDVPTTTELIISEVRVTSIKETGTDFRNTYFEVYNGTSQEVDLSAYSVKYASNGNGGVYSDASELSFTGTLAHGELIVVARPEADPSIVQSPDYVWDDLKANGDDAVGLFKSGNLIDQFCHPYGGSSGNVDPGNGWDVAGVLEASRNKVLIRKFEVTIGNLDWDASRGTTTSDSEWIVYEKEYYQNLGKPTPKP